MFTVGKLDHIFTNPPIVNSALGVEMKVNQSHMYCSYQINQKYFDLSIISCIYQYTDYEVLDEEDNTLIASFSQTYAPTLFYGPV